MSELTQVDAELIEQLLEGVGPLRLRYCPFLPTARQEAFARLRSLEVLYGGAAGGGKTLALLIAALMYADVPGYHALLLRPSLTEFELPGGLIELAHDWLDETKAAWSGETRSWRFPGRGRTGSGGGSLVFGYLDGIKDASRYAGSSFSFLGFDELTRFDEAVYRRMFRTLRRTDGAVGPPAAADGTTLAQVPLRARATSNPGGPGHGWVRAYFVDPATRAEGVLFVPSRLADNPHLDRDAYSVSLSVLAGASGGACLRATGISPTTARSSSGAGSSSSTGLPSPRWPPPSGIGISPPANPVPATQTPTTPSGSSSNATTTALST